MAQRQLLLWFLVIIITLPVTLSFVVSVSSDNYLEEETYVLVPINIPEEESKEDEKSFGKEKNVPSVSYNLSLFVSILESNTYLFNHSKPITGTPDLPYNPPELI